VDQGGTVTKISRAIEEECVWAVFVQFNQINNFLVLVKK
jgi:hypothetical protein